MAHQSHQWHSAPSQYGPSPFQYPLQAQAPSQPPFPYNPSAPSPSIKPQFPYPPPLNQSRFDANSQITSPNGVPPQYSSAGFNPALFHQFGSSALLPPPLPSYPPLPVPNGFPPFIPPPQLSNNFQTQYMLHGQAMQANLSPQQYRAAEQPNFHHTERHNLPQSELQKGRNMNNQEMAYTPAKTSVTATDPFRQSNTSPEGGLAQRQRAEIAVATSSDRTDSISSYNPPSATPPESGETLAESSNGLTADMQPSETSKYQGRGAFEMRELAKGALLSLAPHNIKFSDLLAEGIDAQLLSQLFEEVGLKTTTNAILNSSPGNTKAALKPSAVQHVLNRPSFATDLASSAQPSVSVRDSTDLTVSSTPATAKSIRQQASPAITALAAPKAAVNQPSASPTMERKDVIAAMLAAKMGKPIPRKESPSAFPLGLPAKFIPTPATGVTVATEPPSHPTQSDAGNVSSPAVTKDNVNKPTPKARSLAKTQLVLQKTEQLKRETAASAQIQEAYQESKPPAQSPLASRNTSAVVNGLSTYSQASLPPRPVSHEVAMGNTQMPTDISTAVSQSTSDFAPPSSVVFTSSIPGLFMMDADRDPVESPPLEQAASVHMATLDANAGSPILPSQTTLGARAQQHAAPDLGAANRVALNSRVSSKRPLALDAFDDENTLPAKLQNTRAISSRENQSATSEQYSDDMSDGEIMEIDEGSPVSPLPRAPGYRAFPFSYEAGMASSVASGRPAINEYRRDSVHAFRSTEVSLGGVPNGQRALASSEHELELESIRKKLAEAEERRKAKQNAPRVPIPLSSPVDQRSNPAPSTPIVSSNVSPVPGTDGRLQQSRQLNSGVDENGQHLSDTSESKSPRTPIPVDSVQRAKELREKLLRQRMLKQGLPELNNEVRKTQNRQAEAQARLAQLRREAERREEEGREARKREQEILEEVKRLEEQLEMGMNGQQQFSYEMGTLDQEMSPQVVQSAEHELEPRNNISPDISVAAPTERTEPRPALPDTFVDDINELTSERDDPRQFAESVSYSEDESVRQKYDNTLVRPSAEAALPTAKEEVVSLKAPIVEDSVSDEGGLASPEDSIPHDQADVSPQENNMSDSDTEGSASMSDSESEDYQPAEPITGTKILGWTEDEDDEYDPMDAPVSGVETPLLEDQEDYEPSEAVESLDIQTTPPASGSPVSSEAALENKPEHGDDREHGPELTEANTLTNPQELLPSISDAADTTNVLRASESITSHFTPYQSALSSFKSYRFNRQFTDRVPHGYRSLTYSNVIDPAKPLCPTEAQGGICNDIDCEEQHFKQMSLADEKILVQMSSANDMPDKAARDRFLAGLKLVIADLSAKHISDFDTVASELATYRRRFRQEQDPSLAVTADENEL